MLYKLSDTYLFDNYDKHLYWLGLRKKNFFPVSLYLGYISIIKNSLFLSEIFFFMCYWQ